MENAEADSWDNDNGDAPVASAADTEMVDAPDAVAAEPQSAVKKLSLNPGAASFSFNPGAVSFSPPGTAATAAPPPAAQEAAPPASAETPLDSDGALSALCSGTA